MRRRYAPEIRLDRDRDLVVVAVERLTEAREGDEVGGRELEMFLRDDDAVALGTGHRSELGGAGLGLSTVGREARELEHRR